MRLSCPSCGAGYDLPETLFLTGPRKVRCVKCGHAWMAGERSAAEAAAGQAAAGQAAAGEAAPPAVAAAPAKPDDAAEEPARRPLPLRRRAPPPDPPAPVPDLSLAPPAAPRAGAGVMVAWAASLLILGAGCWAGWEYRASVIEAWPASARLYSALGG
jgi:predicted Zn finger-like uncharacterized protein